MTVFLLAGFLKVLKIIGIVLLCILAFILLLLFLLLFVPFRYTGKGYYKEEHPENSEALKDYDFLFNLSWLLHFVSLSFSVSNDLLLKIKVLGIKVYSKSFKSQDSHSEEDKKDSSETEEDLCKNEEDSYENEEDSFENVKDSHENAGDSYENAGDSGESTLDNPEDDMDLKGLFEEKPDDSSFFSKLKRLKALSQKRTFKNAVTLCKEELIKLLKHVLPRKWSVKGYVGFDDPYKTGEMLAFLGSIYGLIYQHVDIKGNFNSEEKDVKIDFKGHITLIKILVIGITVYFNKNLRIVYNEIREVF